jgi:hypothetical protein
MVCAGAIAGKAKTSAKPHMEISFITGILLHQTNDHLKEIVPGHRLEFQIVQDGPNANIGLKFGSRAAMMYV